MRRDERARWQVWEVAAPRGAFGRGTREWRDGRAGPKREYGASVLSYLSARRVAASRVGADASDIAEAALACT